MHKLLVYISPCFYTSASFWLNQSSTFTNIIASALTAALPPLSMNYLSFFSPSFSFSIKWMLNQFLYLLITIQVFYHLPNCPHTQTILTSAQCWLNYSYMFTDIMVSALIFALLPLSINYISFFSPSFSLSAKWMLNQFLDLLITIQVVCHLQNCPFQLFLYTIAYCWSS